MSNIHQKRAAVRTYAVRDKSASMQRFLLMSFLLLTALFALSARSFARGAPESFADLAEKLSPAVVNISTLQTIERPKAGRFPQLPKGTPFGDFFEEFRDRLEDEEDAEPRQAQSLGSGFIISADGYVVTNNHVIDGADEITVTTVDGDEYEAKLVGSDSRSDLAILKIEGSKPFAFVKWGDSDKDRIGDWVVAIGNPFGLGGTVTAGIISGRNRAVGGSGPDVDYIQTDAPINRGNSGGPLFNLDGDVIGVNSAILSPSGGNVGIGFSIPSNYASYAIGQLKEHGRIRRGWLGVFISPFSKEAAESLGIKEISSGALVNSVQEGSPAETAGFKVGDVIYRWDGKAVDSQRSLQQVVALTPIGKKVPVDIWREGKTLKITVVTGELPEETQADGSDPEAPAEPKRQRFEGMEFAPLNDALRERFSIEDDITGVLVERVSRRSAAWRVGVRPGTVILRVNQQIVKSTSDVADAFEAAHKAGRESVLLLIRIRSGSVHIVLPFAKEKEQN